METGPVPAAERRVIRHFRNREVVGASVKDRGWAGEAKYQALLAVAQAANSRRDLSSVLDAVAGALEDLVPIDLISVVTHEPATVRLARSTSAARRGTPARPRPPTCGGSRKPPVPRGTDGSIPPSCASMERDRKTLVLDHLAPTRARRAGMRHAGAECAVLLPLTMDDEFVAAMVVCRTKRCRSRPTRSRSSRTSPGP